MISSVIVFYNISFFVVTFLFTRVFESLDLKDSITTKNAFLFLSSVFTYMQFSLSFMTLLLCTYLQISSLNKFLSSNFRGISFCNIIKKSSIIYDKICDICENLSIFFLIHNIFFVAGFEIFTIFFFYSVFVYYRTPSSAGLIYVLAAFLWFSFCAPYLLWVATLSSWIELEACKTFSLIQLLKKQSRNVNIVKRSNNFSLLFFHRKPKIVAGGIVLNWKGFFIILGTIFSFTVITIQFYDVSNN